MKPLQFVDESGDGILTSRETGDLMRIIPQEGGGFFAPGLYTAITRAAKTITVVR